MNQNTGVVENNHVIVGAEGNLSGCASFDDSKNDIVDYQVAV